MNDERAPQSPIAGHSTEAEKSTNRHGQLEPLLTARQVAELLGFAAGTIVDWAERGELPGYRIGGRLRFRASEVGEWIASQRRAG